MRCSTDQETYIGTRMPCHRNAKPPWCTKCGPILDPTDQLMESESKGEKANKHQASPDGEQVHIETESELGIIGSMLRADAPVFVPRNTSEISVGMLVDRGAGERTSKLDHIRRDKSCEPSARNARTQCIDDIACVMRRIGKAKRVGKISTRNRGKSKVKQRELRARRFRSGLHEDSCKSMRENEGTEESSEVVQLENLREEQRKDGELKLIIEWIEDPEKVPGIDELRTPSPEVQQLWAQHPNLEMRDRILYRKFVKPDGSLQHWQIVVPKSLRMAFLDAVHSGVWNGHPGIERTRLKLQEIAYWRGWTTDVHAVSCVRDTQTRTSKKTGPDATCAGM